MNSKRKRNRICICCKKTKKKQGSLFCITCSKKDIFEKIEAFRKSEEYKMGYIKLGKANYGKLPTRLEREMER